MVNKACFYVFTWSVEQSGHPAAVADVLFTALCAGGDGCHLQTHTYYHYITFLSSDTALLKTKLPSRKMNQRALERFDLVFSH